MPFITQKMLDYVSSFNFSYVKQMSDNYDRTLKIGQGTFGEVFKGRCKRTGRLVALKKILMENEKEGFPITALREIKMLQKLRHPNITELIDICSEKGQKQRFSFYLVFTFCDHDLAGLLSQSSVKMRLIDIKTMIKHILTGLYKIHNSNILHRDMKAANVLISNDGVLRLADFGLARPMYRDNANACYTNRVVTLWYRPPELLLGARNYGPAIDIWGAGCIMAELFVRSPILQGESEANQLILISQLCGSINTTSWPDVDKLPYYNRMELPQNLPRRLRERVAQYIYKNEPALAVLDAMLSLSPAQRPGAEQLLDHHFFYELPRPMENIKELLGQLKSNMFEYTAGCGAHANRYRSQNMHNQQQQQHLQKPNVGQMANNQAASGGFYSHAQQQRHASSYQQQQRGGPPMPPGARPYAAVPPTMSASTASYHNHHRANIHQNSYQRPGPQQPHHQQQPTMSSSSGYYHNHHRANIHPHPYQRPAPHQQQPGMSTSASASYHHSHHRGNGGGGGPR